MQGGPHLASASGLHAVYSLEAHACLSLSRLVLQLLLALQVNRLKGEKNTQETW